MLSLKPPLGIPYPTSLASKTGGWYVYPANSPSKILVIDDNEVVLEVTRAALEAAGHLVVTHDRPAGCVALILQEKPNVVLMDVNMPRLAGDTVLGVLRKAQPASETVMLLYSSLPAEILRVKAEAVGAHGFIQKSSDAFAVVREVNRWLKRVAASSGRLRVAAEMGAPSSGKARAVPEASSPAHAGFRGGTELGARSGGSPSSAAEQPPISEEEPYASGTHAVAGRELVEGFASSGTMPTARPATVLLIDRDMGVLSAYRNALHADHLRVEYALSGSAALRSLLSPTPPDVAVCDAFMSDVSGIELYRRALAVSASFAQRMIFTITSERRLHEAFAEFRGQMLKKPVTADALRSAVRACFALTRGVALGRARAT